MTGATQSVDTLISFLEHERDPMIVLDPDYNILAANTAYRRQFGSRGQAHVGQKCFRVSHHYEVPCDQAGEHCPMKRARDTLAPDRVLHVHHTPRGQEHVDVELRPILGEQGEVVAYVERLTSLSNVSAQPSNDGLVGQSESFNHAISTLQRAAPSHIAVLLQGESGSGKELFAQALHRESPRSGGPLVTVDCTGLTESLFESELFGHERGAFTGAVNRKIGLAETAHNGTLFLDEIGDVPLAMQVKLLRLIETGTFRRVGGVETLRTDFRLVSATHKSLLQMVEDGRFRRDLYYRISAFPVAIPALQERLDDLPLLIESLLRRIRSPHRLRVGEDAMRALRRHSFPGNIRELRNVLERASLMCTDGLVTEKDLPAEIRQADQTLSPEPSDVVTGGAQLARKLATFNGTRSELARAMGVSERTLYRRLRGLGLGRGS